MIKPRYLIRPRVRGGKRLPFNFRKLLVLELFNGSKRLDSGDVAKEMKMSRTSAASALLRYWRSNYLKRKRHHTGERGRPYFVYSRTEKGGLRYNQYMMHLERGIPLNLHRYKLPEEGGLGSNLGLLVGRTNRDESQG